ncbi:MAG: type II toxin-antitoxin system RelE/ParE family toxin [Clostridia bacterium]|nr:type II toxin-antitoxin system RelE/ParE family toxin [Clostridia bacterium]
MAQTLHNPQAADDLIEAAEKAIFERILHAEAFEKYHSRKERQYPYYRIYVKNYIIFYVVIQEDDRKVMEILRFLFGKSNWKRTI